VEIHLVAIKVCVIRSADAFIEAERSPHKSPVRHRVLDPTSSREYNHTLQRYTSDRDYPSVERELMTWTAPVGGVDGELLAAA
jgi:hypothetical protein